MPPSRADFESRIRQILGEAADSGRLYADVKAGDLHQAVGGYPAPRGNHRMPLCCAVMRATMVFGDGVVSAPPSGKGASLVIRFRLPRVDNQLLAEHRIESQTLARGKLSEAIALEATERLACVAPRTLALTARVALVSCVKLKRASPTAARDLYVSPLFRGMRAYAEANSDAWYILSAEHGVLGPDQVTAPYERTLSKMLTHERRAWAQRVQATLLRILPAHATVLLLAGMRYREAIEPFLRHRGYSVTVPMKGLDFGSQLKWLKHASDGHNGR